MNDIAATIGITNHSKIWKVYETTQHNAEYYNRRFLGLDHFKRIPVRTRNDYWLYIMLCDFRDSFMAYMKERGIEVSLVHARNDIQPIFKDSKIDLPGLEQFWDKQVCIPVGWWLTEKQREQVAKAVLDYDTACSC